MGGKGRSVTHSRVHLAPHLELHLELQLELQLGVHFGVHLAGICGKLAAAFARHGLDWCGLKCRGAPLCPALGAGSSALLASR